MLKRREHSISEHKKKEITDTISDHLQLDGGICTAYLFDSFITRESFADFKNFLESIARFLELDSPNSGDIS